MGSASANTGITGSNPAIGGSGTGTGPGTPDGNGGTGIGGTSPAIGGTGTGNGPGTANGIGGTSNTNMGTGNPLGTNGGGSNPLGTPQSGATGTSSATSPRGTSPLGTGAGGSNPLGTTQSATQGDTRPSTMNPDAGTNLNNSNGNAAGTNQLGTNQSFRNTRNQAEMNQNGTGQTGNQDWRQVYYDNHWWYYTPSNNWLYYNNGRWNPYLGTNASNGATTNVVPLGSNATGGSNTTGRYGVGYRGDSSINSGATGQDLVPSSNGSGTATYRQNSTTNGGVSSNMRSSQRATGSRPLAPSESDIRMYEQQYFNNPATNNGTANPADARRSTTNTVGPGMGVDVTGIPPTTP